MRPTVYGVASLAKVDGAIVVSRDLRVLGFGAKIRVDAAADPKLYVIQPELRGEEPSAFPLETLGATRHQSAARFVAASRKAVAVVVSQDRRLTVLRWDEPAQAVVAMCNADWW
jgi:DNA integrity scanning protein DisA with diadenylate cyclase activity